MLYRATDQARVDKLCRGQTGNSTLYVVLSQILMENNNITNCVRYWWTLAHFSSLYAESQTIRCITTLCFGDILIMLSHSPPPKLLPPPLPDSLPLMPVEWSKILTPYVSKIGFKICWSCCYQCGYCAIYRFKARELQCRYQYWAVYDILPKCPQHSSALGGVDPVPSRRCNANVVTSLSCCCDKTHTYVHLTSCIVRMLTAVLNKILHSHCTNLLIICCY